MSDMSPLEALSEQERRDLCRRVLEMLSDIVEGEAPMELCEQVAVVFAQEPSFQAIHDSLQATIALAHECGESGERVVDEQRYMACVDRVRQRLRLLRWPAVNESES